MLVPLPKVFDGLVQNLPSLAHYSPAFAHPEPPLLIVHSPIRFQLKPPTLLLGAVPTPRTSPWTRPGAPGLSPVAHPVDVSAMGRPGGPPQKSLEFIS